MGQCTTAMASTSRIYQQRAPVELAAAAADADEQRHTGYNAADGSWRSCRKGCNRGGLGYRPIGFG